MAQVRAIRWADPSLSWGLVPTMGYLHDGHLSLVRQARAENDRVAVTIFVNPTQFAPTEDLSTYPRDLERDLALLAAGGVDLVFTPDNTTMYPPGFQTKVTVEQVSRPLEGLSRPAHFQGVTTVVAKLFNIVQPTRAYFGQKDAQQTVVIRRLAADLNFNLEIIVGPTIREADGLAMSSRNVRLSPEQRAVATVLYRALHTAVSALRAGEHDSETLRALMRDTVAAEPLARLDYVSVAHLHTLAELDRVESGALFSLAVFFGNVRLIDNIVVEAA
ncbi:MAG: pantoate--beta-alanine ligase [Chloroflexi bacterium]|nr:pantoate--beta-alanine ligase [Chloroflexota bacterium]MCI0581261.1 pantoate--beta-alanine ligase [Chloroflexota bacterium]MCI0644253.1 pantoate--beta-alanine ligase [Chloroflexota bacterium]MCI0727572.1 pantoate--beta-alanine ligase [Chloroflexota bacterium]